MVCSRRAARLPMCASASYCHCYRLPSPLPLSTRIGRLTTRKLRWNCSPQPVYINTERWRLETGLSQNIWTTWCQSLIRSGSWTFGSGIRAPRALLCCVLPELRSGLHEKVAWVWMYADLCCNLNFFTFIFPPRMMPGGKCFHSSPSVGLYPPRSSQLQEPGDAEDTEQTNWPTEDKGLKAFSIWLFVCFFVFFFVENYFGAHWENENASQQRFQSGFKHFTGRLSVLSSKKCFKEWCKAAHKFLLSSSWFFQTRTSRWDTSEKAF